MTALATMSISACTALGYGDKPIEGSKHRESDVVDATARAFARQRPNFPLVCGASPKEEARRNRRFGKAVEMDTKRILGIGLAAIIMGILGGPLGVILCIIGAVISYLIQKELEQDWQGVYAAAALEAA